jgi:hypothetical protein
MMRRLILSGMMVLVFAASAFSQKGGEVFGGYSYQRTSDTGLNGFNASVTGNMTSWLGLTGEISYHSYGTSMIDPASGFALNGDAGLLGFRVGPKFTSRLSDTTSFFVHTLAGGYRASVSVSASGLNVPAPAPNIAINASTTGFTAAAGAGVDIRVAPRIAVRPVQMDWIYLGSASVGGQDMGDSNGFRYSGGIVFRF